MTEWPITALEDAVARDGAADTYHLIEPARHTCPEPPLFTMGPLPAYLTGALLGEAPMPEIGCYTLHDVQVTFDGIPVRRGRPLSTLAFNQPPAYIQGVLQHHARGWQDFPRRHIAGEAVLLHGAGYDIYGHWLIDFLPRLWVLRRCGYNIHRLRYILPAKIPSFAASMLRACGIGEENLIRYDQSTEVLAVERLLAPSLLRRGNRVSPLLRAAVDYWHSLLPPTDESDLSIPACSKIYVARRGNAGNRQLLSRIPLERAALDAGYTVLLPEEWSFPQQARLFSGATHIAGEYGSGLHNAIFAPPGCRICALRGTSHHPGFAQSGLAEACRQTIAYLFGATPEHATGQSFSIAADQFKTALARLE